MNKIKKNKKMILNIMMILTFFIIMFNMKIYVLAVGEKIEIKDGGEIITQSEGNLTTPKVLNVNIMKEKKVSYITASNYYYNQLEEKADPNTDKMTRSELFLKSTDINHVKKEIFDMVPPKMVLAFNENIFRYVSRTEEEKRAYIKKHYPDSYNFLRSLEERDNQLGTYAERE